MKRFNDKAVILTGADSDIGRATALRLAREGANVILIGMNSDLLSQIAEELPQDHTWINAGNHLTVTSDITNKEQSAQLVNYVVDKYEKVDALINLNTKFDIEQALLSELIKTKGNIVNVSLHPVSQENKQRDKDLNDYRSLNKTIVSRAKDLALKHGTKGIRVNAVVAGTSSTETDTSDSTSVITSQTLLDQAVKLEDIVDAVCFLASCEARLITGVTLPVDGGLSLNA